MDHNPATTLRKGWTTGACATAAAKAALLKLWGGEWIDEVEITLPKGERPRFVVAHRAEGEAWAEAGIIKDAGDDPDVTHGALIVVRAEASGGGVIFKAGKGVGTVTKPGLPIAVGEPAINPVPRAMMDEAVAEVAGATGHAPNAILTVSVPGGEALAAKTWNPRLGIVGGLSILGTTGIVRPFSCAAWIASIHRGIDVARAEGLTHVAGSTGATSEKVVKELHNLPDGALLDMGDFLGGVVKYLAKHPVERLTIAGGIGKLTKAAQGAVDLHSGRSQVDFAALASRMDEPRLATANTALEAFEICPSMAGAVASDAWARIAAQLPETAVDVVVIDRAGNILARAGQ